MLFEKRIFLELFWYIVLQKGNMKCMHTVCEPKWCNGDFYQFFFWFTTIAFPHQIKRPILASAFSLLIHFHFHFFFLNILYIDLRLLKHPDMKWLICRSMLRHWLTWECCNHFHLIFRCSQTLPPAQTSEREFWTIRFHHPSISNTNKTMLFDKCQKKTRNVLNVSLTSQVHWKVEEKSPPGERGG